MSKKSLSALKRVAKKLEYGAAVSPGVPKREFERERAVGKKRVARKGKGRNKKT